MFIRVMLGMSVVARITQSIFGGPSPSTQRCLTKFEIQPCPESVTLQLPVDVIYGGTRVFYHEKDYFGHLFPGCRLSKNHCSKVHCNKTARGLCVQICNAGLPYRITSIYRVGEKHLRQK